jgi:hypothetical protein
VFEAVLYALLCATVSLLLAQALIRRSHTALGFVLGLLPIGAMEAAFHLSLQASIRDCLERACLSAGLPAGCDRIAFGCTEWSGLSQFLFWAAGLGALVVYALGFAILAVRESRRPTGENPWARPESQQDSPRAG